MATTRCGPPRRPWQPASRYGSGSPSRKTSEDELTGFGRPNWALEDFVDPLVGCAPAMVSVMHSAPPTTTKALECRSTALAGLVGCVCRVGLLRDARLAVRRHHLRGRLRRSGPSNGPTEFDLAMIGGCCGIGPSHIAALRAAFASPTN